MIDAQEKWPLGLTRSMLPRFLLAVGAIFIVMVVIDAPVTRMVAELPEEVRAPFRIITRAGNSDWILLPTLLFTVLALFAGHLLLKNEARTRALSVASVSLFIFTAVAAPGIVANLIKRVVGRARPMNFEEFGAFHITPGWNDWSFQSFPSGDATTIFAFAAAILFFLPRLWPVALFGAALVALSRVMVGVHFPSDVFTGILLGTFGAYVVRNVCVKQGWIFVKSDDGKILPNLFWPQKN